MSKQKTFKIVKIALNLFLGVMLLLGGIKKFEKPIPAPTTIIEQVKKGETVAQSTEELKIRNYVFGMKQTDFFWQFLGYAEILAGAMLISLIFARIGAIVAFPITINIFLFHLFLEPNEVGELIETVGLLLANSILIVFTYNIWKPLLINKNILNFNQI